MVVDPLLSEQIAYYRARAGEYDATALVADCLTPDGRAFFIEDGPAVAAFERTLPGEPGFVVERVLRDGRAFRAVNALRDPQWIRRRLSTLGWDVHIQTVAPYFFHGTARRPRPAS